MDLPVVEGDLSADDRSTDNATKINSNQLNSLIDDDIYCLLKQHFLRAPGRGRPVALPSSICLTHRLLIQLYFLKEEDEQNTFFDLQQWLCKIVPTTSSVSRSRITHHVMAVYKQCLEMTHLEAMTFLDRSFDFHALPSPLASFGLNRLSLLDMDSFTLLPSSDNKAILVTNDVIRCLEYFQVQENLPISFVVKWVRKLSPTCQMNDDQVRSKVMSVCKKIRTFGKSKKSKELAEFLTMPFVTRSNPVPFTTNPRDAISAESRAYKDLKKVNEKLELTIGKQKMNISVLTEECESLTQKKESLNQVEVQLKDTVKENRSLKSQLKEKEEKLDNVTQTRTYKHNTLLRKKLQEASQNLESLNTRNEELGEEVCAAKHKLSLAQTAKSNFKKKFEKEKERCKALTEEFQAQDEPDNSLKCENKNKFNDPVRLAYMELQGKAEVAASKCSKVVQIVGKHIFGHNFSMEQLPSSSSALNFADEAHHISLYQVVDKINNSDHYTFASDGTSRQKTQFLERHIILSDKTQLSIGFTEIASDDAKTLLEQTVELLQEITEIFCIDDESKKDAVFRELISKMKCLLSDRAAVNKLFNKKIAEYRREYLGDETATTHFLYCNAHFLLGLARATEDAVQEMEKELSEESNLGRDARKFALFASSTESVAFRLVRLAADCFGPRCDEKSGSRAEWLAYCEAHSINSKFTSYRSNRFNNIFQNSSATLGHRNHIISFISSSCSHSNLKLQSVAADASDDTVMAIVGAIALFNLVVTEPYWELMNSYVPYGGFPQYVRKLDTALEHFSTKGIEDRTEAKSVFEEFHVVDSAAMEFLFSCSPSCQREVWVSMFKRIALKCHDVLKRQLKDFLDGGIFSSLDEETEKILNTCPLTNLSGERLFGDLDYDMLRRRHSTTHHRSTVTMWKHNKTGDWLEGQTEAKRAKIMDAALRNRTKLRKKHLESVRQVREKIKAKLSENEKMMKEKEVKDGEMKASILNGILAQGGVCKSIEELDELFKTTTVDGLKTQIRYRKVFMDQKHLRLTGTKETLYLNLRKEIEKEENGESNPISSESE